MNFTKEQLEGFKMDPLMNFLARVFGTSMEEVISEAEKENSHAKTVEEPKPTCVKPETASATDEDEELGKRIERFLDRNKTSVSVENGQPHYSIKSDENYTEPENPETLIEEDGVSFTMSKDELAEFIRDYTRLEDTFRKLKHTYGIDLNGSADSIYTQYNAIVWNLIEKIFGNDNRDDIADYCFGDSNFDTVEDLYEELV